MRKLLILMLVLGMASAANAAFTLVTATGPAPGVAPGQGDYSDPVDSELNIAPTDYLWVGIYNDTDGTTAVPQKGQFLLALGTGPASWTYGSQMYQPPLVMGTSNVYYGNSMDMGIGLGPTDIWYAVLTDGVPGTFNLAGVLDAKELHCLELGEDAVVTLLDTTLTVLDQITIHQIPEPMTMALLGVGALFLRRRK